MTSKLGVPELSGLPSLTRMPKIPFLSHALPFSCPALSLRSLHRPLLFLGVLSPLQGIIRAPLLVTVLIFFVLLLWVGLSKALIAITAY